MTVHSIYRSLQTKARFNSLTGPGVDNAYDGFGRMTSSTNAMAGTALTLTYEYDANGNRTKITHPDASYFTHVYDGLNRSRFIRENGSAYVKSAFYNNRGLMSLNQRGSGISNGASYDAIGRVSSMITVLPGTMADNVFGFSYSPSSQIKSRTTSNDAYGLR